MSNLNTYPSATAAKAFTIESELLLATEPVTVTQLVERTGIAQSLVSRIIQTMERLDLVRRDQHQRGWVPSGRLDMMGEKLLRPLSLTQRAQSALGWLCQETNETTQLTVESRGKILVLDQFLGNQPIQVVGTLGHRVPAHSCAPGKVWLAFTTDKARLSWFNDHPTLQAYTPNTISSRIQLEEQLVAIREKGYAVDDEEGILGLRCVAAPILNRGKVEGMLTMVAPKERITEDQFSSLGKQTVSAAEQVGH